MAKNRTKFVCSNCGAETVRWMGRCPQCGSWNTLEETVEEVLPKQLRTTHEVVSGKRPQKLSEVNLENHERMQLSMPEVDRPLGGGVVPGSVILWGGEPGIGKSTLILQVCHAMAKAGRSVLYASGEESEAQIKMRAERLGAADDDLFVYSGGNLDAIVSEAEKEKPSMLVIDSIQTMYLSANESPMGSPAQIRDCTAVLVRLAKSENIAVMIIGHVTKEGNLAGPRILEHMVDVVFYLEGDRSYQFRVLRTVKNRFGSTNEIGMFDMTGKGLEQIENPSQVMLEGRPIGISGTCVACVMEGTRPVLSEIQALVTKTAFPSPRRTASGFDYNRMYLLLAVLEKRAGYVFGNQDVYINIIGGLKLDETACDLPVCLAMASSLLDLPVPEKTLAIGEVGLGGEVRSVPHLETRLREAQRVGFDTAIVPKHNLNMLDAAQFPGLRLVGVAYLREAINAIKINK